MPRIRSGLRATRFRATRFHASGFVTLAGPLVGALLACGPSSVARTTASAEPHLAKSAGLADAANATPVDTAALYAAHCASCHGALRYGGYAPPLIPETLARRSDEVLVKAIREGLPATQMPAYGDVVDAATAAELVTLLRSPVGPIRWSKADVAASRTGLATGERRIPPGVSRENLIFVVERGTGSVSVLDGDSLAELDRFAVGRVHGGLKFDLALRTVFTVTRDGTLYAYDLVRGEPRAKAKVAVNTRNVAVSADGTVVAVANQLPASLVLLDSDLHPQRILALPAQPSAVYPVPGDDRFLLAFRDLPQLWSVTPSTPEPTVIPLEAPFEDLVIVPGTRRLVASARAGKELVLYDLERRAVLATLPTVGLPHLFSACFFEREGRPLAAFNHIGVPHLNIVDMERFTLEREIPLVGAGYFVRTHEQTPYLWVDTNSEHVQLVDKTTLEVLPRRLSPAPGKKAMHVEFDAAGRHALLSVWHEEGAVVVYDARSLEEVARLPYAMPVGKYNAYNKTRPLRP